ncbi:MAG: universal stress protein, partial [Hyphomicrobiales bacterium]|nr:universal stress protein [Hyphomicrobiales bacterium]
WRARHCRKYQPHVLKPIKAAAPANVVGMVASAASTSSSRICRAKRATPGIARPPKPLTDNLGRLREIGRHARPFDLIIIARLGAAGEGTKRDAIEHALFESGRPVLLVSEPARTSYGVVVVSWTDTVETARALTASLPLLQRARTVHLLSVQKPDGLPSTADAAGCSLRRHGVQVECASVPERGSVGQAVLAFARMVDADLLIKGAYTQARLRRLIFGGATDYIPLLLSH